MSLTITDLVSKKVFYTQKLTNLFDFFQHHNLPIGTACNGSQICGRCLVKVTPNAHVSTETTLEKKCKVRNNVPEGYRLACCCIVLDNIEVRTTP